MFKKKLFSLFLVTSLFSSTNVSFAATEPAVLKQSIHVTNGKYLVYWKNPNAKDPEYDTWTWYPRFSFDIEGPLNPGSQIVVDFLNPSGKKIASLECETPQLQEGEISTIKTENFTEKKAIRETGNFKFVIRLRNELENKNTTLYTGKFKVEKMHIGNNLPQFKNQYEYYINHDWTIPTGNLYLDHEIDNKIPRLSFETWFKSELEDNKLAAYLYHNGKLVANTQKGNGPFADYRGGTINNKFSVLTPGIEKDPRWELWKFNFSYVISYDPNNTDTGSSNYGDFFNLYQNPGEYEIKVLKGGKLSRSAKFTVESDGKIKQVGLAENTKQGNLSMTIPVKVMPGQDPKWDSNSWKNDMYYGNPVSNFNASN